MAELNKSSIARIAGNIYGHEVLFVRTGETRAEAAVREARNIAAAVERTEPKPIAAVFQAKPGEGGQ